MSRDQVNLKMELPLDQDGFLRRECPHCQEQFKWLSSENAEGQSGATSNSSGYFCPLCGEVAKADAWWTQEQVEHMAAIAKAQVVGPMLNNFTSGLQLLNRPGGSVQISAHPVHFASPAPLAVEPNDMRLVAFSCHPDEPVKVPDERREPVHCLICGQTTPVEGGTQ